MPKFLKLSLSAFSQKTITGVVSDSLNQPLKSTNLIAKPLQEKAVIKLIKELSLYCNAQSSSLLILSHNRFLFFAYCTRLTNNQV